MKSQMETNKGLEQLELSQDEARWQDRAKIRELLELIQLDRAERSQTERARSEPPRVTMLGTLSEQTKRAGREQTNPIRTETEAFERPATRRRVIPTADESSSRSGNHGRHSEPFEQTPVEVSSERSTPSKHSLSMEKSGGDPQRRKRIRSRSRSRRSLGDSMESAPTLPSLSQGNLARDSLRWKKMSASRRWMP